MKITGIPFGVTDWSTVPETVHPGELGEARWRTLLVGDARVRMVSYSPGYVADHWCSKGHILLVLDGTLVTELQDGRRFTMAPGMSYQVADGEVPHRSRTEGGARLFIVD